MVKKRGLASNRGLDALLGSIKTEKLITGNLIDAHVQAAVDDAKSAEKLNAK
ncbi:MAG TPA: chromosome partitioning protein ParB, partial [Moraxella sp.]|nr:chromosome partitioning protein ParB [Moraxella sp.]